MEMSQSMIVRLAVRQTIRFIHGDTIGDLPLYSLHRISNLMRKRPISASPQVNHILKRSLILANKQYREESGNAWNCLTSNNLAMAIEDVDRQVGQITSVCNDVPVDQATRAAVMKRIFERERAKQILAIKNWFHENYDNLLYNTGGHIPWAIVQNLRCKLSMWIAGESNPFSEDIEEVILAVAKEHNVRFDSAESTWKALGGKLFTQE